MTFRSGFVAFTGRPNAGKSTLMNAIVGAKVAITSDRPQTTRRVIRGILTRPEGQLIIIDTPGMHRPRTLLGERLNDQVREAWSSVDVIGLCLPADQELGPGDRFIATQVREATRAPLVAIITKADSVSRDAMAGVLLAVQQFGEEIGLEFAHIIPVSAREGYQVDRLTDELIALLPEGQHLYPDDASGDEDIDITVAELIREAALEGVTEELPHSIAVVVDEIVPREDRPADKPLTDVRATVFVERDSQKGIIIGKGGSHLRQVGAQARPEIERLLGVPVFLDLHVKVAKDWQRDPKQLRRLGL